MNIKMYMHFENKK